MNRAYVSLSLMAIIVGLMNFIIPFNLMAQGSVSEKNNTYPMALQRIPTKNASDVSSENNNTYPMALQRIPTKNASDMGSGNDTYPMASQRIPTVPQS
jgi:hypothetical protein